MLVRILLSTFRVLYYYYSVVANGCEKCDSCYCYLFLCISELTLYCVKDISAYLCASCFCRIIYGVMLFVPCVN